MRTNTAPWDYQRREHVSDDELARNMAKVDIALNEYRALFTYKNLCEINPEQHICLNCGVIVPKHKGRLWEMTDRRDGAFRFATFCVACHDAMIITPEELGMEEDYRDLKIQKTVRGQDYDRSDYFVH